MIQGEQHPRTKAAGKSPVGILIGVVFGGLCVFVVMNLMTRVSNQSQLAPPTNARPSIGSGASSALSSKEELRRRLTEERAATESFFKAQGDYRDRHRTLMSSARARHSDARKYGILVAGARRDRIASELSTWVFSYPESASVAARLQGDSRLPVVTELLISWYAGLDERVAALIDAECALAAATGGARRDRELSQPSMLELITSRGELREPAATRLSTHFGFDDESADQLAAQLRPRWLTTTVRISVGIARIEKSRDAILSDHEKEQLLCNGQVRLIRAVDGDTIEVLVRDIGSSAEFTERVRLLNVDTPEIGTPGAGEATSWTEQKCQGNLTLEFERPGQISRDRYGRVLAFVFADRVFVNAELIKRGHSKFYSDYGEGRYAQYFRFLESRATPYAGR